MIWSMMLSKRMLYIKLLRYYVKSKHAACVYYFIFQAMNIIYDFLLF